MRPGDGILNINGKRRTWQGLARFIGALTCVAALLPVVALADAARPDDATALPAALQALMQQAQELEQTSDPYEGPWQAASHYCTASRQGVTEAQYRLGMLYALGRGVPENAQWAASLFSMASSQGHAQAHTMLETIRISSTDLPPCVLAAVPPEARPRPPQPPHDAGLQQVLSSLPAERKWIIDLVGTQARWNEVDPRLILSIIAAESNFETRATSPKSAMGLMQLIPETAERFNVLNAYNASQNIRAGLAYVRWLLSYYRGDVPLMLAAYNAGEGTVDRYKGIPPYRETRQYVQRIMALYGRATHPFDERAGKTSPVLRKLP